ncbi:response regulator [Paracraurococcus lichenis]|uniref:Response regulator n=1 Tax=Paracraurococcus lichenis TaxID=3064888 RepID=A0ABT9E7M5_9PROT|nr:response regulator [Paracraurococcus sp. LOR1-02]MDO9712206.1 response regulator [Paracraurococcus sp. LOR1-02]
MALLAEDEALIALSFTDILEAEGCQVTVASDGAQALAVARRMGDTLDVLVTDLNMPNMTGEDLIRTLRAEQPGLPIVVVTGAPPAGGLAELRRLGGTHGPITLLRKPVDYDLLVKAVRSASGRR